MPHLLKFLAFETSTDMMSVAVGVGDQTWHVHTQGGANASAQLIPSLHNLLAQAQIRLTDLSALVIGHGPGSFTGLRTACSVAQGLAMGANLKVIPVDTLMAVAEDARASLSTALTSQVSVVMDARMGEVYGGAYAWHADSAQWHATVPLQVGPPAQVAQALITEQQRAAQEAMVGREVGVLIEKSGRMPGQMVGKSDHLHAVHVSDSRAAIGDLIRVRITGSASNSLAATTL